MTEEELGGLSPEAQALFAMSTPLAAKSEPEDKEAALLKKFDDEIEEWGGIIMGMSNRMKDINKCIDVQCELIDNRHRIVDRKHKLLRSLSKFNQQYKEERSKKLDHYATKYDRKLTSGEREKMADGDVAKLKHRIDLVENHINHIDQIFKTIENMIYGMKHRIELEDYLRKM